jgi:hypothetical protein
MHSAYRGNQRYPLKRCRPSANCDGKEWVKSSRPFWPTLRKVTIEDHASLGTGGEPADIFRVPRYQKHATHIKVDAKLTKAADMMHSF